MGTIDLSNLDFLTDGEIEPMVPGFKELPDNDRQAVRVMLGQQFYNHGTSTNWSLLTLARPFSGTMASHAQDAWDLGIGFETMRVLSELDENESIPRGTLIEECLGLLRRETESLFDRVTSRYRESIPATERDREAYAFGALFWQIDVKLGSDETRESEKVGMFFHDACLYDELDSMGPKGQEYAKALRDESRTHWREYTGQQQSLIERAEREAGLWRLWCGQFKNKVRRAVAVAAHTIWVDRVRPALLAVQSKQPALALNYAKTLLQNTTPSRTLGEDGRTVKDRDGRDVARFRSGLSPEIIRRALDASNKLVAYRFLTWFPHEARRVAIANRIDLRISTPYITIFGGLSALTRELGIDHNKGQALVRAVLEFFQDATMINADGSEYHGLLTWTLKPHAPGRPALIEITPNASMISGGGRGKLVPVARKLPPFVGSPNEHASQASLQFGLLIALRERARELVEQGGVSLTAQDWTRLADEAGVTNRRLPDVIKRWMEPDGILKDVGSKRITLGDTYSAERTELEAGGHEDLAGHIGGTRASSNRRAKRKKLIEST